MRFRPAMPNPEWQNLFTLCDPTPAQKAFLDTSVISVEMDEQTKTGRLIFKGGHKGPSFRTDDPKLTFKKVTKGAFKP